MRFIATGPIIPDHLLEERDRGNVVFFCGAGVSFQAGLPDFLGLAREVVSALGTPADYQSRIMLDMWKDKDAHPASRPPLDQIFNSLHQEYPPGEIDYLVA